MENKVPKNTLLKVMIFSFYLLDPKSVHQTILHVACQKKSHPKFNSIDPFGLSSNKIINNKFYSTLFAIMYLEGKNSYCDVRNEIKADI